MAIIPVLPMLNVGAAYAPVEFAFNSEVAHAAQIIHHNRA